MRIQGDGANSLRFQDEHGRQQFCCKRYPSLFVLCLGRRERFSLNGGSGRSSSMEIA